MSFWRRWFGRDEAPKSEPPASPGPGEPPPPGGATEEMAAGDAQRGVPGDELALLRRLERPGGASATEALAALRSHQGRPSQAPVLAAILDGIERAAPDAADSEAARRLDGLRVACAHLLDERGQRERALALIEGSRSVEAMMVAADLHAALGHIPQALGTIERVLARDIDAPGARERHERWSAQLGRVPRRVAEARDAATVVAPELTTRAHFRLLREVARGGAGAVYEAEDELLGRRLAFKAYHKSSTSKAQIEREARIAVRLRGPGVLRLYDADPEAGWVASEWIARGSLRDALKGGRVGELLPLSGWVPALLRALERVHAAGLVHADLKPANVLFRSPTDPLLADFGISRARGEPSGGGTPGYLAPERLEGGAADPKDDVYAVGRIIDDVLAARDDAREGAASAAPEAGDAEIGVWAQLAARCIQPAAARPDNATALLALLDELMTKVSDQ